MWYLLFKVLLETGYKNIKFAVTIILETNNSFELLDFLKKYKINLQVNKMSKINKKLYKEGNLTKKDIPEIITVFNEYKTIKTILENRVVF